MEYETELSCPGLRQMLHREKMTMVRLRLSCTENREYAENVERCL